MISKLLEIRDSCTRIAVLATSLEPSQANGGPEIDAERAMLKDEGYATGSAPAFIMVTRLGDQKSSYDPYHWDTGGRTMTRAHIFIREKFNELRSGDVIDVEFILGETKVKKTSEYATMFKKAPTQ